MASSVPKEVKKVIGDAFAAETWFVALFTTVQAVSTYAACTNEVASGGGYSTGGKTIGTHTSAYSGNNVTITASNTAWTSATFSATCVVVYETAGGLIRAIYDLGGTKTVTAGTFTLQWDNTNGLVKIS